MALSDQNEAFFNSIAVADSRAIESASAASRQAVRQDFDSRGLGQSTLLSQGIARVNQSGTQARSRSMANIAQLRFQSRESELRFQREKELQEGRKRKWWETVLPVAAGLAATFFPPAAAVVGGAALLNNAGLGPAQDTVGRPVQGIQEV